MITIDGSYGEGGGQMLRTALSLSAILNQPFRMINIRLKRKKPGLKPQHVTAVRAAQAVSGAEVTGDQPGAMTLSFVPHGIHGGNFDFDIGTAGSMTLVLQTVLPILLLSGKRSFVSLTGGSHLPFSPPFDFMQEVFRPTLGRLGCNFRLSLERHGFYPRGGGRMRAEIMPTAGLRPLNLLQRGKLLQITGCSAVSNLPETIAERQRTAVLEALKAEGAPTQIREIKISALSPGTFVFLRAEAEHAVAGFTALGERGKPAEVVGREAADEANAYLRSNAVVDPHLADQLVLYLSLCKERSAFTTSRVTQHLLTNLWLVEQFRRFEWTVEGDEGDAGRVIIN